jgi:methyltransferase (TIGR00027 family)
MDELKDGIRNVSDTALWVAYFRAMETQRVDALFRDPYAERLAGERGAQIAKAMAEDNKAEWSWVTRTYLFDTFLSRALQDGADLVLNLGAGLDSRPYRMELNATLQWVEVDFAEILSYKEGILANDRPRCRLARVALDLFDVQGRRALFSALHEQHKKIVVVSEGLLLYFAPADVAALASDLALGKHFQSWIVDLASTIQLILMQRGIGRHLSEANAGFKFGPPEGADFFKPYGWESKEVRGTLQTAAELNRAPEEFLALLPEPECIPPHYPWTGVCLLERRER